MDSLMGSVPTRTVEKGTVFYGAEDGPEVLFLLMSGKVEIYRLSPDGKKLTVVLIEPGAIFGEMSLIGQQAAGRFAAAAEDSVISALTRDDGRALMVRHPEVALRVIEVLAGRLQ